MEAAEQQPEKVEEAKLWDKSNDKNCINARFASDSRPTLLLTLACTVRSNISRRDFPRISQRLVVFNRSSEIFNFRIQSMLRDFQMLYLCRASERMRLTHVCPARMRLTNMKYST